MNALGKAARRFGLEVPRLLDYRVRIPPGGRTAALVETVITWQGDRGASDTFSTIGVDPDQLAAAVIATEKMLNAVALAPGRPGRARRARS
jgi:D-citramalate synthase